MDKKEPGQMSMDVEAVPQAGEMQSGSQSVSQAGRLVNCEAYDTQG